MTFDHVDDFQHISEIAKEDDVGFVRMTAQIGAKFVARAAHADRRAGKIGAFAAEFAREAFGNDAAAALLGDIAGNGTEIGSGARRKPKPRHL